MAVNYMPERVHFCRQKVPIEWTGKVIFIALVGLLLLHQLVSLYRDSMAVTNGQTTFLRRPLPARFHLFNILPKMRGYVLSLARIRWTIDEWPLSTIGFLRNAVFIPGSAVVREVDEMAVGMLVVGKAGGLISGMRRQLESLLTFSSGDPLHLVVVTDSSSRSFVAEKLADVVSRWWFFAVNSLWNEFLKDLSRWAW